MCSKTVKKKGHLVVTFIEAGWMKGKKFFKIVTYCSLVITKVTHSFLIFIFYYTADESVLGLNNSYQII